MPEIDPFDKALRCVDTLINALKQRGHTVTFDETCFYLYVDAGTDHALTITTENAREMEPETLLQWVEERLKR